MDDLTTEPTTDRVQVHPGVPASSVAADVVSKANEALDLIAKVNADLDRVDELATDVREAFHAIVLELAPHYRGVNLDWVDGPAEGLGWTAIWTALVHIGDRYDPMEYAHLGLTLDQIEAATSAEIREALGDLATEVRGLVDDVKAERR